MRRAKAPTKSGRTVRNAKLARAEAQYDNNSRAACRSGTAGMRYQQHVVISAAGHQLCFHERLVALTSAKEDLPSTRSRSHPQRKPIV